MIPSDGKDQPEQSDNTPSEINGGAAPEITNPKPADSAEQSVVTSLSNDIKPTTSTAIEVVWQWLTYSLWGGTLIALGVLISGTLAYFMVKGGEDYSFLTYTISVLIVLLPLAFLTNAIYSKRELAHKHGFAAVVMVFNAVVVFLVSLGSAITAVVTALNILLSYGDNSTKATICISSLIIAILGMLLFIRIVNPVKLKRIVWLFPFIVIVITLVAAAAAAFGPLKSEYVSRSDKLIESNLTEVNDAVQDYARSKNKLPDNLKLLSLDNKPDAKKLIDENLVEYKPAGNVGQKIIELTKPNSGINYNPDVNYQNDTQLKYELCVTYKRQKGDPTNAYNDYNGVDQEYNNPNDNYISTYEHKAGRQCYKQSVYVN